MSGVGLLGKVERRTETNTVPFKNGGYDTAGSRVLCIFHPPGRESEQLTDFAVCSVIAAAENFFEGLAVGSEGLIRIVDGSLFIIDGQIKEKAAAGNVIVVIVNAVFKNIAGIFGVEAGIVSRAGGSVENVGNVS